MHYPNQLTNINSIYHLTQFSDQVTIFAPETNYALFNSLPDTNFLYKNKSAKKK